MVFYKNLQRDLKQIYKRTVTSKNILHIHIMNCLTEFESSRLNGMAKLERNHISTHIHTHLTELRIPKKKVYRGDCKSFYCYHIMKYVFYFPFFSIQYQPWGLFDWKQKKQKCGKFWQTLQMVKHYCDDCRSIHNNFHQQCVSRSIYC